MKIIWYWPRPVTHTVPGHSQLLAHRCVSVGTLLLDFPSQAVHVQLWDCSEKALWIRPPHLRRKDSSVARMSSAELCHLSSGLENKTVTFYLLIQMSPYDFLVPDFQHLWLTPAELFTLSANKTSNTSKVSLEKPVLFIPWICGTYGFSISKLGSKAFKTTCKTN